MTAQWFLGAMNDGLFIINTPPSPANTDVGPHITAKGPTVILPVANLPTQQAQAIVDEHNRAIQAAVAAEREACAEIVAFWPAGITTAAQEQIAAAIRARKDQP